MDNRTPGEARAGRGLFRRVPVADALLHRGSKCVAALKQSTLCANRANRQQTDMQTAKSHCKPLQTVPKGGGLEAPCTPPWNVWFATVCSDCCRFAGRFAGGLHGLLLLSLPIDHGIEDRGILATRLRFQSPAGAPQELAGACPGPVDHAQGPLDAPRCVCRGLFMPLAAFAGAIRCWRPRLQWGFYAPR